MTLDIVCCDLRDLMTKPREDFCDSNAGKAEDQAVANTGASEKENVDPLACADIVKKGPANKGLSPLAMGGAEN